MEADGLKKSIVILTSFLMFSTLVMSMIPNGIAGTDSMRVFLFIEERDIYRVGETIDFTVYVLDWGEYITPDSITIKVNGVNRLSLSDLTRMSNGIYNGTYELRDDDTPFALLNVEAAYGKNRDSMPDNIAIWVRSSDYVPSNFVVTVVIDDPSDFNPRPGDSVEITVTTTDDGINVDPDVDPLTNEALDLSTYSTGDSRALDYTIYSTGVYKATLKIAPTLTEDTYISITAVASYGESDSTHSIGISVDFYNVWLRKIYMRNTSASFEIWVSDLGGKAVPGAFIYLTSPTEIPETTDASGKASFTISYPEPELGSVSVKGAVKAAGKTQNFRARFPILTETTTPFQFDTHPGEFDVFCIEGEATYSPMDEVNRRYIAFNNTHNWTNEMIHYYAIFRPQPLSHAGYVIASGNGTTDDDGIFYVNFTVPNEEGTFLIFFESGTDRSNLTNDGKFYQEHLDTSPIFNETGDTKTSDPNLHISAGDFVGTKVTITANMEASSGYIGKVEWGIENVTWRHLSGSTVNYLRRDGDKFTGNIVIPEFLSKGDNYTIRVTLIDPVTGETHVNYVWIKPSNTIGTTVQFEMYILSSIMIIIVAILMIVYLLKRKGKKDRLESERRELLGEEEE